MAKVIKYTNDKNYSLSISAWLGDSEYDHTPVEGPYISVTGLLKPMRMIVLEQRLKKINQESDVEEIIDIDRYVASRLGSAVHSAIEHSWTRQAGKLKAYVKTLLKLGYPKKVVEAIRVNPTPEDLKANPDIIPVYMEQRAYKKIGGWTIGGMYDFIGNGILEDFKSTGSWGYLQGDKDQDYIMQGSLYRWLNPELVTEDWMRIQCIITDWSKLEALKNPNYPQLRIIEKQLNLMDIQETDAWIRSQIRQIDAHATTPEPDLPLCTNKELWQKPPQYKYYGLTKKGTVSKRATAVYDNPTDAYDHAAKDGNKGDVREIPAVVKRCGYCACTEICSQFAELDALGIIQMPS